MNTPNTTRYTSVLLPKSINDQNKPRSFVKHEWEEIVDKLCDSDDPHLRKIGHSEKGVLAGKKKY